MGNKNSKKKKCCSCLCTSKSISIDDTSFPTFDKILSKQVQNSGNIDSLPIHDISNEIDEQLTRLLNRKYNYEYINLTKKFQLNIYLKDYLNRLKYSKGSQKFQTHFLPSNIIYPSNTIHQYLIENLNVFVTIPPESVLPDSNSSFKIHEQLRSKCYFIPLIDSKIEPHDDIYKQKYLPLDRTHVVITLENAKNSKTDKIPFESEPTFSFTSNDSFQTGFIRIDNQENISKDFLSFISYCSKENICYLSSNLIQQWFNTLILVNQTCTIAKRFLSGDKNYFTCLLKNHNNFQFVALRLPTYTNIDDQSSSNLLDEKSERIIDAFSPVFLSDNKMSSNNAIHVDYEEYCFAFVLSRWPKLLIDNYLNRRSKRRWPSKDQMNLILKKSLLLIPHSNINQWEINFDLIENYLFELMNDLTRFLYVLCQQLFSLTYSNRLFIKHSFLNYCEKYGLPFSNHQNNLSKLINDFLKELIQQIKKKHISNYFNHEINLLNSTENYNQWFDYINKCYHNQIYFSSSFTLKDVSNRIDMIELLFNFTNQLYETFQLKRSEFYLNDEILLNIHKDLLNNEELIENIQINLTKDFEINSELVHICLNQIRKSQTSLIFHYTWTIYIQYLHTYYNVLWKFFSR